MTVPIALSKYDFYRQANLTDDGGDEDTYTVFETAIPGTTVYFSGTESVAQGSRERVDARVFCDVPASDVFAYDRIHDTTTDQWWYVSFVRSRLGLGLDHLVIGVYEVTGIARGTRDA